ncbi:phosphoribosylformylglycinamidine synthase [Methanolinea mesophila]|uniref:phosphoribosylformylglycinamidine synthase subunit PurL n=1 Tax=Methanolinea mesophila TaxID=547055 RepID=UPI001AE60317|nr:phosphoribosylformylglycinamidine synthase subunit PurL [Methanolinea mesophila]MBP1928584.1 phosphoribosylformylglycinamidine synthase [Methanolinea mesophila]
MLSTEDQEIIRKSLGREPTDVETACFENLWSEHCSYRSTRHLLKTLPTTGDAVLLGPGDDAAIVRYDEDLALAVGMESHNHPSYVDPHDGAATGVGGIVRDVLSMGARPVALMDPLYFGPLDREKNRYLLEHVIDGIGGYGNCIGVPVVRGDLVFDEGFNGNPLVNVVCVGIVHPDRYITARVKKPGSRLVLIGASTGRDGLGGASFASRDLSEDSEATDRPSVQIGDPFTEKLLIDAILEMAETGKILSCRDLGAAGLAGASSEMCSTFGGRLRADRVHLREPGMKPVEIMLAESQERMLIEVDPSDVPLMGKIAEKYDLGWSDIGEVIAEHRYIVEFNGKTVADIPLDLLVGGTPGCSWEKKSYNAVKPFTMPAGDLESLALKVLSFPEVASRQWVVEQYDHDVQIRTVTLAGDAAVLRLGNGGLALSCGCNPRHIYLSPYAGAANAVLENAANLACVGATPLCIVNCLNFASPVHPEIYWQLEQSVLGMGAMARTLGTPVVGGNVSLYNESDEMGTQIKPTPSIGMLGKCEVRHPARPSDGWVLALAGDTGDHFGGSVLDAVTGCGGAPPPQADPRLLLAIRDLMTRGRDIAVTDLSQGGLIAALSDLAPCADITLRGPLVKMLFAETYGRFLVACRDERALEGLAATRIGEIGGDSLILRSGSEKVVIEQDALTRARNSLSAILRH